MSSMTQRKAWRSSFLLRDRNWYSAHPMADPVKAYLHTLRLSQHVDRGGFIRFVWDQLHI